MSRSRRVATCLGLLLATASALPATAQKPGEIALSGRVLTAAAAQSEGRATVLLFDDLNVSTAAMEWAKKAAIEYVARAPQGSAWALLTTSGEPRLALTSDVAAMTAAVAKVTSHSEALGTTAATQTTGLTEKMHGGGSNDEVLQNHSAHSLDTLGAAVAYTAALPGPPVLVVISTGFPVDFPANGTNLNDPVRRMNDAARASGVLVNAIDPAALDPALTSTDWQLQEGVLNGLARATGGTLEDNRNQLASAFDRLASNPGLTAAGDKLRQGLAGEKIDELPVVVAPAAWKASKESATGSHLIVIVSPKGLQFAHEQGGNRQHLRVAAVLTNAQGQWIAAREGSILLDLSNDTLKKLDASGIKAALELPAPPGAYHVVIVVQELHGGATTAMAANLAVR